MSPSGIDAIVRPSGSRWSMRSNCAPPTVPTTVLLASLKSVSSVAAQKTGATGMPVLRWSASASANTLSAFDSV